MTFKSIMKIALVNFMFVERIYSNSLTVGNNFDLLSNRYWKNAHELSTEAIKMKMTLGLEKDYIFFVTIRWLWHVYYM